MVEISSIQFIAGLVTVGAGLIAIYVFFIKRPDLAVDLVVVGDLDPDNQALVVFYVWNRGRRYAEDVFVSMRLDGWKLETILDDAAESMLPPTVGTKWTTTPHPAFTEGQEGYERHNIYLEHPVYHGVEFEFAPRIVQFEPATTYHIDYLVACRSNQPRGGTIDIIVDEDGQVEVGSEHSTIWKRIKNRQI